MTNRTTFRTTTESGDMQGIYPFRTFLPFIRWVSVCLSLYMCCFYRGDKEGKRSHAASRPTYRTVTAPNTPLTAPILGLTA